VKKAIHMLAVVCLSTVSLPAQQASSSQQSEPTLPKVVAPTIPQTIEMLKNQILSGTSSQTRIIGQPGVIAFDVSNLGTNINYHDGPVMETTHNVYFIWYGNWTGHPALTILPQFIRDLSASTYQNINNTYFDNSRHIASNLNMSTQIFDNYSQGTNLSDSSITNIVSRGLSNGLPTDANGIYYVLTSADVNQSGASGSFCTNYCGWHTHASLSGADIKFSFVGNEDRCGSSCEWQSVTPNGNTAADSMANTMTHELSETLTDPDTGNGWFRTNLAGEDGDLCNFNFGPTFNTSNGSLADITLNTRNYMIQQMYINSGTGGCTMAYRPVTGLCYSAYVSNIGFLSRVCDGDVGGTVHQSRAMEGIEIFAPTGYSVCYQVYASGIGWMSTQCDGAFAGTMHQSRQIEAMKVWFRTGTGHVEYFSELSNVFWTGPSRDGAMTGTTGQSRAMEAVVIRAFQ
jgi:hypothetical protein